MRVWRIGKTCQCREVIPSRDSNGLKRKNPVTRSAPLHPVRQTALHDPVMPATIRQGLSNSRHRCTVPRREAISRHPAITWYPTCHRHSQDALGAHLPLPLFFMGTAMSEIFAIIRSTYHWRQKVSRKSPFSETQQFPTVAQGCCDDPHMQASSSTTKTRASVSVMPPPHSPAAP